MHCDTTLIHTTTNLSGLPTAMTSGDLHTTTTAATAIIREEQTRQQHLQDPAARWAVLDSTHLDSLKKRHTFLNEYNDDFLASTPLETLLKLESTSIKLHNLERGNNVDEKLPHSGTVKIFLIDFTDTLLLLLVSVFLLSLRPSKCYLALDSFKLWRPSYGCKKF